ncbi:hypothetical protein F4775DRAFT_582590 [Biscogniauxia sp. FL1348]|nr:hypothetical protein F4775DRAFT_582590 [Biscogniauxia sp. FL1348]
MASQDSVASTQPDQRHLRLIAASAQANEARVNDILAEEPPWTSSTDHDALRQALQKVAARGKLSIVRLLLEHGAEVNVRRESESPALVKAAEGGHTAIVSELLERGADPNARGRTGQTALFSACMRGHNKTVEVLLSKGADIEALDKEGRSPLLFLASEKPTKAKWTVDTLKLLVENKADLEVKDHIGRTPLLWAATNGNVELARVLLENNANISATNYRGRTPLHLAAESNDKTHRAEMVKLLLDYHANPSAVSDGGWTPLHNATQSGHIDIVNLLLGANANLNAELSNGMTPLHWAAFNGSEDIVRVLLEKPGINLNVKDSFDRTPMLCAAEKHHAGIVQLLSPARSAHRLSPLQVEACKAFEATIVDFGQFEKKQLVSKHSVYELLYGWDHENDKPKVPTLTKNIKYEPDFRWIHLPANNTLLAKSFIEAGHRDIESFKALEKCFDQEHRGPFAHAHFMRTFCHRIPAPRSDASEKKDDKSLTTLSEEHSESSTRPTHHGNGESTPKKQPDLAENGTGAKKKSKAELFAERHPKKSKRARGPPGNPPHRQDSNSSSLSGRFSAPLAWETSRFAASSGKIVLFMPFLHYETDERRRMMSSAIKVVREGRRLSDNDSRDSLLVKAYLNSTPPLHPRRTLDQFFYHGIDTSARDTDQVVYRYCKRHHVETKVFMVDQLWLWVIGKDLIITCFPQRWDQPKQDPLNVLDGIIEETNAKTRPLIQSVYDLAMLITSRCSGLFDRHRLDDQNYQFLDMFENSIGVVTDRESRLFSRFNRASAQSAQWLQLHRRRRQLGRPAHLYDSSSDNSDSDSDDNGQLQDADRFPDALLDIGVETSLLAEIKDIRDELTIIAVILDSQFATVSDLEASVTDELRGGGVPGEGGPGIAAPSRRSIDGAVAEIRRRAKEQRRGLEMRQNDIRRMDSQAQSLYESLTDLLDLKQKHSNALEARFAGDQAVIAAKQGQTVMVFTIVTIVFLPMSFIAAFFAINLEDWATTPLTIAYVSNIPLIAMAFKVTDIADGVAGMSSSKRNNNNNKKKKKNRNSKNKNNDRKGRASGSSKTGYIYSTDDYDDDDDSSDAHTAGVKTPLPPGKLSLSSRRDELPLGGLRDHHRHRERDADHALPLTTLRKASLGSGGGGAGGVSWARPSFERRGGIGTRFSEDLERGYGDGDRGRRY